MFGKSSSSNITKHWHTLFKKKKKNSELDLQTQDLWPSFLGSVSKQQAIVPGQCYQLEDNTSSFKDFHGSRNNRFTSPEQAAKNRIQHPSNVLHFFNAQPDISVEIFNQVRRTSRTLSEVQNSHNPQPQISLKLVLPSRSAMNWELRAPQV